MKADWIYPYSSQDELCKVFANEIADGFRDLLEYWEAIAVDDREKLDIGNIRMGKEPHIVWENAYEKIVTIMTDEKDKTYNKRIFWFIKSSRFLSITWCSGFYDHLLSGTATNISSEGESMRSMISQNTEYIIDRKKFTIVRRVHPEPIKDRFF